ncbi:MAG: GGDEF domain-containing protein [Oscillospiraceae bacterium]|nr:GGDEF domain-containing protein [Oscillospiraceae bacterium]
MEQHKKIALLTAMPESIHVQRLTTGMFAQCRKYGYHALVFGAMTHLYSARPRYNEGEANIYELVNFRGVDGVILDTTQLQGDNTGATVARLCERIEAECGAPVTALEMEIGGFPLIRNENEEMLRETCRHMVRVHGKHRICLLTGQKDNEVAEERLAVMCDELSRLGAPVPEEYRIYGDFWYTSGEALAERFVSGELPMPEAVIAASDHMALGLIERLTERGVRVPEDLLVMGFDSTPEGITADITLSSYEAGDAASAARAVDYIRHVIEPDAPLLPYENRMEHIFHPGMSCGCQPNFALSAKALKESMYFTTRNYSSEHLLDEIDIGLLMESYVSEQLTASETPEECIECIYLNTYLIYPYLNFFLCLKEDWLDTTHEMTRGYPETMRIVSANTTVNEYSFFKDEDAVSFPTAQMIPPLEQPSERPFVFYFAPVHFNEHMLGYAVLQRELDDKRRINMVFRNWLRLVNNALEMIRSKKRLQILSNRDEMTGLYNRRGLYSRLRTLLREAPEGSRLFACVIDMDGLKYINDTFGHHEGDFGIRFVSAAAAAVTQPQELCGRAGGDEFYIFGVGQYPDDEDARRTARFMALMQERSAAAGKPYPLTASIGCAVRPLTQDLSPDEVIREADSIMYRRKTAAKRARKG